jgi:predicted membrane channel-forming protein YqfA (hemolysin III family)
MCLLVPIVCFCQLYFCFGMFKKTLVYNSQSHLTPTITTVSLLVVLNQYMTVSGVSDVSDIIFVFLVTAEVNVCFLSSNFLNII